MGVVVNWALLKSPIPSTTTTTIIVMGRGVVMREIKIESPNPQVDMRCLILCLIVVWEPSIIVLGPIGSPMMVLWLGMVAKGMHVHIVGGLLLVLVLTAEALSIHAHHVTRVGSNIVVG
jgi:hypothetical protein